MCKAIAWGMLSLADERLGMQASYMGFPATTGASFLPYLITDKVVAPESCRHCYSEHLALMPNCYFVNDYKAAHMVRTSSLEAYAAGWGRV